MFWTHVKHLDLKFGPNLLTQVLDSRNPRDHTNQVMYQTNLQLDLFQYVYDDALFSHFLVFNFIFTQFKAIRSCCFLLIDFAFVLGKNHVFEPIFIYLPFYDSFHMRQSTFQWWLEFFVRRGLTNKQHSYYFFIIKTFKNRSLLNCQVRRLK